MARRKLFAKKRFYLRGWRRRREVRRTDFGAKFAGHARYVCSDGTVILVSITEGGALPSQAQVEAGHASRLRSDRQISEGIAAAHAAEHEEEALAAKEGRLPIF